jgi:hypothetical protein
MHPLGISAPLYFTSERCIVKKPASTLAKGASNMAEPTENKETASTFEPTDQIESFLIGLIAFIQALLRTLRDLAFNQTRFSQALQAQPADAKYTKPVTFITLVSFLSIRIFRFGLLTLLLAISTSRCHAETLTETQYPSVLDELKIPSIEEIILYGIPTLLIVLLVSQLLKFVLLKKPDESGKLLVSVTYYSVGFQYLAYLILFAILSAEFYAEVQDYYRPRPSVDNLLKILALLCVLWILFIFNRLVLKTIDPSQFRVAKRGWKQLWLFLWTVLLLAVTTASGALMSYSLAKQEVEERLEKPFLAVSLIGYDNSASDRIVLNLLVLNNSKDQVPLNAAQVYVYGNLQHPGEIINSCQGAAPVVLLQSGETCWLTISFERTSRAYSPSDSKNLIKFYEITPSGEMTTISEYIEYQQTNLDIAGIE